MYGRKNYLAHRVIWEMHNGPIPEGYEIDHIDIDKTNNNISNLRVVTHKINMLNTKAKGCSFRAAINKWTAQLMIDGKQKHLGCFETEQEANKVYLEAKSAYGC